MIIIQLLLLKTFCVQFSKLLTCEYCVRHVQILISTSIAIPTLQQYNNSIFSTPTIKAPLYPRFRDPKSVILVTYGQRRDLSGLIIFTPNKKYFKYSNIIKY